MLHMAEFGLVLMSWHTIGTQEQLIEQWPCVDKREVESDSTIQDEAIFVNGGCQLICVNDRSHRFAQLPRRRR